ncbi:MAG: adventurous gliding motility lipoprotein CglB [Myxococcaceae bacterium]|nr:adventurous gliding motility lipoprotein CglB [Myxococcaceae bacterium]
MVVGPRIVGGMRASAVGLVLLAGCTTYDFEPVNALAIAQTVKKVEIGVNPPKPALFLVVDKSGSMDQPVTPTVTRMEAMKSAMGQFLTQSGSTAHLGMLPFPAGGTSSCEGGDIANVAVPLDQGDEDGARLAQAALGVKVAIDGLRAAGGTPTALTMRAIGTYPPMLERDRDRFAVLLTDGLPNCNPANDPQAMTCTCTIAPRPASCTVTVGAQVLNQCLDDQGSADEIDLLKVKGIRTIVIGFGTDVANAEGAATMARMAAAGGFTRPCTTSADCNAGDSCNPGGVDPCGRPTSTCGQSFFQAGNAAELGRAMEAIRASVTCDPCLQVMAARPSDAALVSVLIDDLPTATGPDTWVFRDSATAPTVEFVGGLCARLRASNATDPVTVEIRSVESL